MNIFGRIFGRQEEKNGQPGNYVPAQMIGTMQNSFSPFSGNAYENDIYREGVDAIARNAAKLKGSHVITYAAHDVREGECKINNLLQVQPNPFMNAYDFLYKMVTHYYLYNNAFAFLKKDDKGNLLGIYPITAAHMDYLVDGAGALFGRFMFENGKTVTIPYSELIHLRRHYNTNDLLGDNNAALLPALELAHTENEGIIKAIQNGAYVRGIIKFTQIMAPDKLKEEKEQFTNDYLQMSNSGGIVAIDNKMEYQPIETKPVFMDAAQSQAVKDKVYNYLGITEKIVNSSYNEDEFSAFYESVLEPRAIQMGQAFTNAIFSEKAIKEGHSIEFSVNRIKYAKTETKISLIKEAGALGLITVDEGREILDLPAIGGEEGKKRLQTLNVINANLADKYQGGNNDGKSNKGNES